MKRVFKPCCRLVGLNGAVALTLLLPSARAADWPQWRGPQRNGISTETGWLSKWPASGPRKLWGAQLGEGFSSVAVAGGRVYTMGNSGGKDTIFCLQADTGRVLWRYSYSNSSGGGGYGGPRATPTVDGANVYTLSNEGKAFCLNAATGKIAWQKDLQRETGAQSPQWGFAGSVLIEGNLALYNVGQAGVAVDKRNGKTLWVSGRNPAGYASPVSYTTGGQKGVAFFVGWGIVALNPANGKPYWQYPWQTQYDVNAADPIFSGDTVFLSSNYGKGCALVRVSGGRPSVVWQNRNMKNHFNTCVLVNGYLYGNDENTLRCIDFRTGQERWGERGLGKGGIIAADGKLIILTERGELKVAAANPSRYTELARAQVLRGTCWTHPVLANGLIYCRSHEGELVCMDVRGR